MERGDLESNWDERIESFEDMRLKDELLRGVYTYGFERPSAIQQLGIKPLILGRDFIGQAQSGTGKTATYVIGLLQLIDISISQCQVLVIAPTRELAQGINCVMKQIGCFLHVKSHACIGGTALAEDIRTLERGVHVVVGTPGRLFDMLARDHISTQSLKLLVLDEADEILSRGFKEMIQDIFKLLPGNKQVALFYATMSQDVIEIIEQYMRNPVRIIVKRHDLTLEGIKQYYIAIEKEDWKLETLVDLFDSLDITQVRIYCNTRNRVEQLAYAMTEKDFVVSSMHEDMEIRTQQTIMREFCMGVSRILIMTDLVGRLDIPQVSLVVNYDLPTSNEKYIRRIGRSGHYGRKGLTINFVTDADVKVMRELERYYNTQIMELPIDISELM